MPALKNAKHEAFARAIVEGKSGRAAYCSAGYKASDGAADVNASRLLKNAKVAARVAELKAAAAAATTVTAARVLKELGKVAFANMADYMRVGADGDPRLDWSGLTRDQTAALAEVTVEDFRDGRGDPPAEGLEEQPHGGALRRQGGREVRRVRFKLCSKLDALRQLGEHFGLFKQVHEHTGKNGGAIETRDVTEISELEAARRVAFLLEKAARTGAGKKEQA